MTDQQFAVLLTHLRVLIVFLGIAVGILLAFPWGNISKSTAGGESK